MIYKKRSFIQTVLNKQDKKIKKQRKTWHKSMKERNKNICVGTNRYVLIAISSRGIKIMSAHTHTPLYVTEISIMLYRSAT